MTITMHELDQFHRFAAGKVSTGSAESLGELVVLWETQRQGDEPTIELLRECAADMERGIGRPLREVDAELRKKHGFAPRKSPVAEVVRLLAR